MKIFRLFVAFALVCFALSPSVQAVVPPPPGGYPNFTTAAGDHALQALSSGVGNTAIGTFSLFSVSTGNFNTAVGAGSLDLNQADSNTAVGTVALLLNTAGTENTAIGTNALVYNSMGNDNTAVGAFALENNIASGNTAIGRNALINDSGGQHNTVVGASAGTNITTGSSNTALGQSAGSAATTGDGNVYVGAGVAGVAGESNTIHLADNLPTASGVSACFIGGIFGQFVGTGAPGVVVDVSGKLGTVPSARRFKHDIKPMDNASEAILALKPATFQYKSDVKNTPCFGLIAEEVAEVNPNLVVRDQNGEIYSVRYDQVNAMLLNEFLKEHRKVEKLEQELGRQEVIVAQQQKEIAALTAGLQKVSAQLEVSRPAQQVAAGNP